MDANGGVDEGGRMRLGDPVTAKGILEELRRRPGERSRPELERDNIDRLLKQFWSVRQNRIRHTWKAGIQSKRRDGSSGFLLSDTNFLDPCCRYRRRGDDRLSRAGLSADRETAVG